MVFIKNFNYQPKSLIFKFIIFLILLFSAYFLNNQINFSQAVTETNCESNFACRVPSIHAMNINIHGLNYKVTNNASVDLFVPVKDITEYQQFLLFYPSSSTVVSNTAGDGFNCGVTTIEHNGLTYGTILKNDKCWLDKNLGASQVCIASTDANCYGDLYQWGRLADGHQSRSSLATPTLSTTDNPGSSMFITNSAGNYDWRDPQNNNLWQGASGINNPCPTGFRPPTVAEFTAEANSWSPISAAGAYSSTLKFPVAGYRLYNNTIGAAGSTGYFWTTDISGTVAVYFNTSGNQGNYYRATGFSVRCILDEDQLVTLTYLAGTGGSISGQAVQSITSGQNGSSVTAVPDTGYVFVKWSDDSINNPRTDTNVTSNISVTAEFSLAVGGCSGTIIFNSLTYQEVDINGVCWLDRNLGASQVCTSSTDANCYGDLYQWGRLADGHQSRESLVTPTLSTTDDPGSSMFIANSSGTFDWRNPQNNNLWQGVSGINNPCPSGFRLPTEAELTTEMNSWSPLTSAGALASPLKLPMAGLRNSSGNISFVGSGSYLWSSTVSGTYALVLTFNSSSASLSSTLRVFGRSVRCLRN